MIEIIQAGPFSTIQDLGRFGFQHLGVPISGALDRDALQIGNALIGNAADDSAIEICFGGFTAKCHTAATICVTGSLSAEIEVISQTGKQTRYQSGHAVAINAGDSITIPPFGDSLSCLLCLSSGVDVPYLYGSQSTTTTALLGGFEGRHLAAGDKIALGAQRTHPINMAIRTHYEALMAKPQTLRILLGPQDYWFTAKALAEMTRAPYEISPQTSRMGMRLNGTALTHKGPADIISDGMVRGAIQVPADGQPIIAMADHGTMGGYTKIGVVIHADISGLGRLRPHDEISFTTVTQDEAHQAYQAKKALFDKVIKPEDYKP